MNGLARRTPPHRRPERMDAAHHDPADHARALAGLARLNRVSRTTAAIWTHLEPLARQARDAGERLRVLDLACGGGDLAVDLWRRGRRCDLPVEVTGCDLSPVALRRARDLAPSAGAAEHPGLRWAHCDVLDPAGPLPALAAGHDVVVSSLFLHHLEDTEVLTLLGTLAAARPRLVLIDDLRRTRVGLVLAWCASRSFSRSPIVHHDASVSVARAFRLHEVSELAARAGLDRVLLRRRWPARFQLLWTPAR